MSNPRPRRPVTSGNDHGNWGLDVNVVSGNQTTERHERADSPPPVEPGPTEQPADRHPVLHKVLQSIGFARFSGVYVWILLIIIFAIRLPDTFATTSNIQIVAGDQAITAMVSLALLIPVAAGVFDLSVAAMLGFAVCVVVWLQSHGMNAALAALVTVAIGLVIGAINGFIVVKLEVDSFIATLGMSSVLAAGAYWVTGGQQIVEGISSHFTAISQTQLWGITLPFYYMIAIAVIIFVIIEYTPVGRYLFAVGGNPQAAKLAGVRTSAIYFGALTISAGIAALVGIFLAARLGSASQDVGPPYLLPAFSAVFLGSTQLKPGRVNVVGTLIAVYLLATGVKGLQLSGAAVWVNDLFNGVALIVAVALAARGLRKRRKA